jgi:hypothetical protein
MMTHIFSVVIWIEFETRSQMPRLNFKLSLRFFLHLPIYLYKKTTRIMDRVLNSISNNLFIYYHAPNNFLIFLSPAISLKLSLLLLQEIPTDSISFDRFNPDPYLALSSHLYCIFLFLFRLLFFDVKLKYINSKDKWMK